MSVLPRALRMSGRVLLSPGGEVFLVFAAHTWCAGLVAQPTCLADRSLGSTKLRICMGRLISSPAEGLGKQYPPGAERPSKDAGGQESRKDVCVSRWKGSSASRQGRAETHG